MLRRGFGAPLAVVAGVILISGLIGAGIFAQSAQPWTQLSASGGPPAARYTLAAGYAETTDRMMIFGGGGGDLNTTPTMLSDSWVLANADGLGATPAWTQLAPTGGPPSGRDGHSGVYDPVSNSFIVFAGDLAEGFCNEDANDVWVLAHANGLGGTPTWTMLSPTGGPPSARSLHSAVYDSANNRMIVFAGIQDCGSPNNEVWVLENANGTGGTPNWVQLSPTGTPPDARSGHTAVYDAAANSMIIFGGTTATASVNATWLLSNANGMGGTPAWTQLSPSGGPPSARSGHSAVYDSDTNEMIVFAGDTGAGGVNDTWVLSNANGSGGTPTWTQLAPTGGPPGARARPAAVMNAAANPLTIFAGWSSPAGF